MEAVPRLPMVSFQLKVSPEPTSFATKLKQVCANFPLKNYFHQIIEQIFYLILNQ